MRKELIITFLVLLISLQYISAIDTPIHVKTLFNDKASIFILEPEKVYSLLNSYHVNAGSTGLVDVVYSGEEKLVNIKIQISDNGKPVILQNFENVETGKPVYIQAYIGNVTISDKEWGKENVVEEVVAINDSLTNSSLNNAANQTENGNSSITGMVSSSLEKGGLKIPSYVYFIVLGIVGAAVLLFTISKLSGGGRGRNDFTPKVETQSSHQLDRNPALERELEETRRRLKEAQSEIIRMKNQDRIKEIEKRINEEKSEIERLKKVHDSF